MLRRGAHRVLGIAAEMIVWWFSWAKRADLHYKIWFPGLHYATRVTRPSPEDAVRLERYPVTSGRLTARAHPHEEMGFGPAAITLHFVSPQDYGLSNPAFAPGEATAICT
jgi:hypothetical protein